jgi:Phosphodiester glycosidase
MRLKLVSMMLAIAASFLISKVVAATLPLHPVLQNSLSPSWIPTIAQASPAIQLTQQGSQIILNGRPLPLVWSRWQQKIGITDSGLMQIFGVELLDSEDVTQQPVQWFSQPLVKPMVLPVWLTGQYRYLDITELAQQAGWQLQVSSSSLRISTPSSRVMGLRQGRQNWGDRIVVELDQPTPWQVIEQDGEFAIVIDAQTNPALVQHFVPELGNWLNSLRIETSNNQITIRVGALDGIRPYVWTIPDPNRLVIDIGPDVMVRRNIHWAPDIHWRQEIISIGTAQFPVVMLEVDPRQSNITLKPIVTNPTGGAGIAPLIATAQRWQVAAAINGGFFNRNNQLPLGAIRQDGRWLSGPILNRGAIAWNDNGEILVGRLTLQNTITTDTGQQYPVSFFNTGYVGAGIAMYTPEWGSTYTPIVDNEVLITAQNNRVSNQRPAGAAGQISAPIPSDGYLLVVRSYTEAAHALRVGTMLRRETVSLPADFNRYPQIMGAGPLLIQNQHTVLNAQAEGFSDTFIRQAAPRSAIGRTREGTLIMATVQNRMNGPGPTLLEIAQIMQQLGAVDALNLDGGSSTSLYLGGRLLNRSPHSTARVHNGIGIFIQPNF